MLKDLGSTNGVFVNGIRLERGRDVMLRQDDLLRVGSWLGVVCTLDSLLASTLPFEEIYPDYFAGPVLKTVLSPLVSVASTNINVMIHGETGSGKENAARLLHKESKRPGRFIAVNCKALTPTLAASELFGHEQGAFSGASQSRQGYLREADAGTLFLDEVDKLHPDDQGKLLRVIDTGVVPTLGSSIHDAHRIDLRIVSAVHSPPEQLVEEKVLSSEFHHRLEGILIALPGLRHRKVEIPYLLTKLVERRSPNGRVPEFDPALVEALYLHDWPGNVRELGNLVDRCLALYGEKDEWKRDEILEHGPRGRANSGKACCRPQKKEISKQELIDALRVAGNSISQAAVLLKTSRAKVYRLKKKYGVE